MVGQNNNISRASEIYTLWMGDNARLLLPTAVYHELEEKYEAAATAARASKSSVSKPKFDYRERANAGDVACIRAGTGHDLADAQDLATKIFKRTKSALEGFALDFSRDLFVAVALFFTYQEKHCTFPLMLEFLSDPAWDSTRQMLNALRGKAPHWEGDGLSPAAAEFLKAFHLRTEELGENAASMVFRCVTHWRTAFALIGKLPKEKTLARTVPIFQPEAVAKALGLVANMREESRAGGDVLLKTAQHNEGRRTVPDARKAVEKLEAAKYNFENLVEPIARLQTDLTLASAMPCDEFRIVPILLLGDPGIGKTFLAMQLADALGVATDKISAGGAQGGFQLAGSHSSWHGARPGSLFTLLAEGKSASPVLVIDEVDKIGDSKYPVLPVLLDLFEPHTARSFKDEFFDMQFDASRVIFVLTANSLDGVPAPLLSRIEVFDVPRPELAQRLRIIEGEAAQLRRKTKLQIVLDERSSAALAERQDVDLRKTTRLVREAFTRAMRAGEDVAKLALPKLGGKRTIGFGC